MQVEPKGAPRGELQVAFRFGLRLFSAIGEKLSRQLPDRRRSGGPVRFDERVDRRGIELRVLARGEGIAEQPGEFDQELVLVARLGFSDRTERRVAELRLRPFDRSERVLTGSRSAGIIRPPATTGLPEAGKDDPAIRRSTCRTPRPCAAHRAA